MTRCIPGLHEGRTKGGRASDICLFFARGACHLGHRCNRRHRLPTVDDEVGSDIQHDTFGRNRETTEGDDQNGPGSVFKENRTLFVGDFGPACTQETLRREFSIFGPIVQIRFFPAKSLAFVQFQFRATAEFAKEAMSQQVIEGAAVGVRWAKEDPNPRRVAALASARAASVVRQVQDVDPRSAEGPTSDDGSYPDTSQQYDDQFEAVAHFLRQQQLPGQQPQQLQPENTSHLLPEGWAAIRDAGTGYTYFAHTASGRTQWEPPTQARQVAEDPELPRSQRARTAELPGIGGAGSSGSSAGGAGALALLAVYGSDDDDDQ